MLGEELMRKVKNRNILISTGKTGGHIIPALSVGRNYIIEFDEVKVIYASIEDSHIFKDFLKKGENLNFIFLKAKLKIPARFLRLRGFFLDNVDFILFQGR